MKNMEQGVPVPQDTETREVGQVAGKHTAGPWMISQLEFGQPLETGAFCIGARDDSAKSPYLGPVIAYRAPWPERAEESLANARLIAAAPALLAACKLIASYAVAGEPLSVGDIREVTAAIAAAEGGQ